MTGMTRTAVAGALPAPRAASPGPPPTRVRCCRCCCPDDGHWSRRGGGGSGGAGSARRARCERLVRRAGLGVLLAVAVGEGEIWGVIHFTVRHPKPGMALVFAFRLLETVMRRWRFLWWL
ncbi:hypothetical protein PVAP13_7NG123056 [Panicum virgatum]|uniref:Uncharacterized protein n=1 Tax=Panicum virgatum TaxID=38727 RepID=A0A8T0PU94_PANVG|nr:hypothetical protein PVAP13_7NG123056 [Panicum virgatum]